MTKKNVNMRLGEKTLERIDRLKQKFEMTSRTQVITYSVSVANTLMKHVNAGDKIILRDKDGHEVELVLIMIGA